MDYINILLNPERMVNLNSLQNGGAGIIHSIKTNAAYTAYRWYYYFLYIFLTYIVLATICSVIIFCIFIRFRNKLAHPYWYTQPMNFNTFTNIHSLFPSLKGPHVIQESLPEISKWTNYHNMKFHSANEITQEEIDICADFLRENYRYTLYDKFKYVITSTEFISNFLSHNNNAYIGMFYNEKLNAVIGSYPVNIELLRDDNTRIQIHKDVNFENIAYCIDYLCVKMGERKKEIAPKTINTLVHKVRHTNNVSKIFISKHENIGHEFIVPLTSYRFSIYRIKHWFHKSFDIHSASKVLEITSHNIHFFYSYLFSVKDRFMAFVYPDMTNIIELLKQNCIHIYLILQNDKVLCSYIFKNDSTEYNNDKSVMCIASINDEQTEQFFIQGFYHVLEKMHHKYNYNVLHLEEISHNNILNKLVMKSNTPFITNRSGWFFYNYAYKKLDSSTVLIIN